MVVRTRFSHLVIVLTSLAAAFGVVAWGIVRVSQEGLLGGIYLDAAQWCLAASAIATLSALAALAVHFRAYRGLGYLRDFAPLYLSLRHALLDAKYSLTRHGVLGEYEELPKVSIDFSDDRATATLRVENSIRFQTRLEDVDVSSALAGYILERSYLTDDRNWLVCELVDASVSLRLRFKDFGGFERYSRDRCDGSHLFLDARTTVPLSSALVVGQTGSGKSYALYSLILQLSAKGADLSLCDPKNSGVAVLGRAMGGPVGVETDEVISVLEGFVSQMTERKAEMGGLLSKSLDATYADFGLKPHVMVIDEYAALAYGLRTRDKKCRDHVAELIASVVLQGRQLGFFIWLAMQKSDASLIDTAMRENLPLVVVLGNAQPQTIVTAFGPGTDVPARNNAPGDGVFTEPHVAPTPKLVQFPDLAFLARGLGFLGGRGSCNDPRPHGSQPFSYHPSTAAHSDSRTDPSRKEVGKDD